MTKNNPAEVKIDADLIARYLKAKEAKREYEALDKVIKAQLKATETETLIVENYTLSLKHQKRYMLDQKALKAVLPEAWEEYGSYKDYSSIQIN